MSASNNEILPGNPSSNMSLKYPYYAASKDVNGGSVLESKVPGQPEMFFTEKYSPSGGYESVQYHPEAGEQRTVMNRGRVANYTAGSVSNNVDGHVDQRVRSTMRTNVNGDSAMQVGRNNSYAVAGEFVESVSGTRTSRVNQGSESMTYNSSAGDVVNEHTGNYHEAFQKDLVTSVTKNAIFLVNEGDYAIHVQAGNYDSHIKEKARLYADNDILIESKTKITLKVGNSTIVMTPTGIDMDADRIDLN